MHRLGDVLDALFSNVRESVGQPVADVVAHRARDADATRLGQGLQPRRDVYPVAENIVAVDNDVAEIDSDPESDALLFGLLGSAVEHRPLDLDGAADRIDDAAKFRPACRRRWS